MPPQLSNNIFKKNDDYYELIGNDIWLMDNHKWALVIWDKYRNISKKYALIHIDYHWDAGYDYWNYSEEENKFLLASHDEIINIVQEGNWIRFDSFICPAIAKGFIDEVHFHCFQGDNDGDIGIYTPFLKKYKCSQAIHKTSRTLTNIILEKPLVFDFCIDIFNKSDMYFTSDIWTDDEINSLLYDCKELVKNAEIITISMSYCYSGTKKTLKDLLKK